MKPSKETIQIGILWHNEETRDALLTSLRDLYLLNEGDEFPAFVTIAIPKRPIPRELLDSIDTKAGRKQLSDRMKAWQKYLKAIMPVICETRFALVELLQSSDKVHDAVREACAREGIASQMKTSVKSKPNPKTGILRLSPSQESQVDSAVRDLGLRQIGAMLGSPTDIYHAAEIPEDIAARLDVVALYLKRTTTGILYPLATRLRANGAIEVLFPHMRNVWMLYGKAGPELGRLFASTQLDKGRVPKESELSFSSFQLLDFAAHILTECLDAPSIALIDASVWRDKDKGNWQQLKNHAAFEPNVLDLGVKYQFGNPYQRNNPKLDNLVAIIRIRTDAETPQYITTDNAWGSGEKLRDSHHLTRFIDETAGILHYFSIGGLSITAKAQDAQENRHAFMSDGRGGGVPYKHPKIVEFLPFFIHPSLAEKEQVKSLCRVANYLRVTPAWIMGNTVYPYPMHLAETLVNDQVCILGLDE